MRYQYPPAYVPPTLAQLQAAGLVAVIRQSTPEAALQTARDWLATRPNGCVEIAWTTSDAYQVVRTLQRDSRSQMTNWLVGAATVTTPTQVQKALDAGAQFITMPHTNGMLLRQAEEAHVLAWPGILTPTELVTALEQGAYGVKVFPVQALGGVAYVQQLRRLWPKVPLLCCGGLGPQALADYQQAGAVAIGVGQQLANNA